MAKIATIEMDIRLTITRIVPDDFKKANLTEESVAAFRNEISAEFFHGTAEGVEAKIETFNISVMDVQ